MKIPVISGPTATGKTNLSIALSEKFDIEIVSADAYQVYKYMNIGTAKPDKGELSSVRHHLIDILEPDKTYSAGDFFKQAQEKIKDILTRGKMPIVTGGTGMYVQTLIEGIFSGPGRDDDLRNQFEDEIEKNGVEYLYEVLFKLDPEYAVTIEKTDKTRIMRALEINKQCRMNVQKAWKEFHENPEYEYELFVLTEDRNIMYDRINKRVDKMFDIGWVDEVKNLLEKGYNENMDSFKAIGYREICSFLKNDDSFEYINEKIKTQTRRFAKRQLTWFRHMGYKKEVSVSCDPVSKIVEMLNNY